MCGDHSHYLVYIMCGDHSLVYIMCGDHSHLVYIMCGDHSHYLHTKSHTTSSNAALLIAIKLQTEFKQFTKSTHSVDKREWKRALARGKSRWSNNVRTGLKEIGLIEVIPMCY